MAALRSNSHAADRKPSQIKATVETVTVQLAVQRPGASRNVAVPAGATPPPGELPADLPPHGGRGRSAPPCSARPAMPRPPSPTPEEDRDRGCEPCDGGGHPRGGPSALASDFAAMRWPAPRESTAMSRPVP